MTQYNKPDLLPVWAETGDKVQPTNPELAEGWPASSTPPSRQRFNFVLNWAWQGIRYLFQRSVADWDSTEDYPAGAHTRAPNGKTYRAKVSNTNKEPSVNATEWERWGFTLTEFYAEQTLLAPKADPILSGNPRGITRPEGDNTTSLASTEFVTRAINAALTGLIPVGIIVLWNGSVATIPTKWQFCDGTNGTPDLRDRFVVGAGGAYAVDAIGGQASVALSVDNMPAHNHTGGTSGVGDHTHGAWTDAQGYHGHSAGTYDAGNHNHQILKGNSDTGAGGTVNSDNQHNSDGWTEYAGNHSHGVWIAGDGSHGHNIGMNGAGAHSHSFTTNNTGGSTAHENRPPYWAKAFIMRVAL
jgi:microcystin-dependent protein